MKDLIKELISNEVVVTIFAIVMFVFIIISPIMLSYIYKGEVCRSLSTNVQDYKECMK